MARSLLCFALLVAVCHSGVRADTPANCTYEEIRGKWTFFVGQGGHDNKIDCSKMGNIIDFAILVNTYHFNVVNYCLTVSMSMTTATNPTSINFGKHKNVSIITSITYTMIFHQPCFQ